MKKYPESSQLTYPYPVWQGCTLSEIFMVSALVLSLGLCLSLLVGMVCGEIALALLFMIPIILFVPKFALKKLARLKEDKPYGYFTVRCRVWLSRHCGSLFQAPYIDRVGRWSTQRHLVRK